MELGKWNLNDRTGRSQRYPNCVSPTDGLVVRAYRRTGRLVSRRGVELWNCGIMELWICDVFPMR